MKWLLQKIGLKIGCERAVRNCMGGNVWKFWFLPFFSVNFSKIVRCLLGKRIFWRNNLCFVFFFLLDISNVVDFFFVFWLLAEKKFFFPVIKTKKWNKEKNLQSHHISVLLEKINVQFCFLLFLEIKNKNKKVNLAFCFEFAPICWFRSPVIPAFHPYSVKAFTVSLNP